MCSLFGPSVALLGVALGVQQMCVERKEGRPNRVLLILGDPDAPARGRRAWAAAGPARGKPVARHPLNRLLAGGRMAFVSRFTPKPAGTSDPPQPGEARPLGLTLTGGFSCSVCVIHTLSLFFLPIPMLTHECSLTLLPLSTSTLQPRWRLEGRGIPIWATVQGRNLSKVALGSGDRLASCRPRKEKYTLLPGVSLPVPALGSHGQGSRVGPLLCQPG